jgi:hypothetical protein
MASAKIVGKIENAVLRNQLNEVKMKYYRSLEHFSGLMEAVCESCDEFPEGFPDAFFTMVLSEVSVYEDLFSKTEL